MPQPEAPRPTGNPLRVAIRAKVAGDASDRFLRYETASGLPALLDELVADAVRLGEIEGTGVQVSGWSSTGVLLAGVGIHPLAVAWQVPPRSETTPEECEHAREDEEAEAMFRNSSSPYHGLL